MKENGVRPGAKVVHSLIMGSIINGRRDLAEAYAEEFRYNGVKYGTRLQPDLFLDLRQSCCTCIPERCGTCYVLHRACVQCIACCAILTV